MANLRWRLTLSYLLVVITTVSAISSVTIVVASRAFDDFIIADALQRGRTLAPFLSNFYQSRGETWSGLLQVLNRLTQPPGQAGGPPPPQGQRPPLPSLVGVRVVVADDQGRVVADTTDQLAQGTALTPQNLSRGAPILVAERRVGTVILGPALGIRSPLENEFLRRINRWMLLIGLGVGGISLALGVWLADLIARPARELTAAAHRIARGERLITLPVRTKDELGQMSQAFNIMAQELEQQATLRRQMVADIAHELRTPLSVMQAEIEGLEDGLQSPMMAAKSMRTEIELLTQLIDDLRLLAQTDAGEAPLVLEPTDVGALVRDTVLRWQGRAGSVGITLSAQIETRLPLVLADTSRVTRALTNLLANALRHTPREGRVTVVVRRYIQESSHSLAASAPYLLAPTANGHPSPAAEALLVSVSDTGEGIPTLELERVFERFARVDRARSRHKGGSGLGLAIARQAIELHGGVIWAESSGRMGEGTTVSFSLPLGPEASP